MKTFKTIDLYISIVLFIGSLIFAIIALDDRFIFGYFVTGGWQVISMIVHQLNGWFTEKGSVRNKYHITVLIIILAGLLGIAVMYILLPVLLILLFAAPLMAFYYINICYKEIYVKMQRPLALLK